MRITELHDEATCIDNQNGNNVWRKRTLTFSETNYKVPIKRKEEFRQIDEKWGCSSEQMFSTESLNADDNGDYDLY
jgi:hypothetical protein